MNSPALCALTVLVAALVTSWSGCSVRAQQASLEPFSSIVTTGDIDLIIEPCSSDSGYVYQELDNSAEFQVQGGTLYIGTAGIFNRFAVVRLSIPLNSLSSLTVDGNGDVVMMDGFQADRFNVDASGVGGTFVAVDVSGPLTVRKSGRGTVVVTGSSESLDLEKSGNGEVIVSGVQGDAVVDAEGRGEVFISGGPGMKISGTSGSGGVFYTGEGSCSVSQCVKVASVPNIPLPRWDALGGKQSNCVK